MVFMPNLIDPTLEKVLRRDKLALEKTKVPIITVSASYREDVKGMFGYPEDESTTDVVMSRAHYSMAAGVAVQAWYGDDVSPHQSADEQHEIHPEKAWVVDPTNYVSHQNWQSIILTENIGKLLARRPILKKFKDLVDKFGRSKLPILGSITPPLLYLTENIHRPLLSFHIAAGNALAAQGKPVVQMITDPHVRDEYVMHADREDFYLLVFDENTKAEVMEKAGLLDKKIDPDRVIVTGPPVDPRIIAAGRKKRPWRSGVLRVALTTGGLGTNKTELRQLLRQLLPELRKRPHQLELLVYTGTHQDIYQMVQQLAAEEHVRIGDLTDKKAKLRVIYHPQIVDANELLIKFGFPWAHGFITKPSGDMAYDVAASGSFFLTLAEWGEWEHHVREVFTQQGVARKVQLNQVVAQLSALQQASTQSSSWIEQAMLHAQSLDKLFLTGAKNILKSYQKIAKK